MADKHVNGHHFGGAGGACRVCGISWEAHSDKDSPRYGERCGGKPEANAPVRLLAEDE
jgi:hypothetical protein